MQYLKQQSNDWKITEIIEELVPLRKKRSFFEKLMKHQNNSEYLKINCKIPNYIAIFETLLQNSKNLCNNENANTKIETPEQLLIFCRKIKRKLEQFLKQKKTIFETFAQYLSN